MTLQMRDDLFYDHNLFLIYSQVSIFVLFSYQSPTDKLA